MRADFFLRLYLDKAGTAAEATQPVALLGDDEWDALMLEHV